MIDLYLCATQYSLRPF